MGAVGDHALNLTDAQAHSLQTATRYNLLHAVLIVAIALSTYNHPKIWRSGWIITIGTILFSYSIYAAILSGIPSLTYFTPIGGITLMVGWLSLCVAGIPQGK